MLHPNIWDFLVLQEALLYLLIVASVLTRLAGRRELVDRTDARGRGGVGIIDSRGA